MRKRVKQGQTTGTFGVQKAFEQFQKSNVIKNLSPATIDFYSRKMQPFFDFFESTEYWTSVFYNEVVKTAKG